MRILFVDDDPDIRALAIRAVAREFPGADCLEATDRVTLDGVLSEQAPDILVTDFDLCWTNGLDVFDCVKAANPLCCTVMFTGTGNEELAVRTIKRGFDDYIVKGATQFRRLATAVRTAYDRSQELRKLGENRDLVLKELYHRLHNNLQIVISLLRMTEKNLETPRDREQLADLGRRIQALSALQEQFYRSEDFRRVKFADFLHRTVQDLNEVTGERVLFALKLDAVELPVDLAVPFGLIANEVLSSFSVRAFPAGLTGHLSVTLEGRAGRVILTLAGDGEGHAPPQAAAEPDLSMRLVQRLAEQIEAEVSFERSEAGATCRISVPV